MEISSSGKLKREKGKRLLLFFKRQEGFTLFELIISIILLGFAVPSILSLYSKLSVTSARNKIYDQTVAHAEAKMEEIIAVKEKNWDWYKKVNQFTEEVVLPDNFKRSVKVRKINNWGNVSVQAWEILVAVSHPQLTSPYTLTVRLTQYHE